MHLQNEQDGHKYTSSSRIGTFLLLTIVDGGRACRAVRPRFTPPIGYAAAFADQNRHRETATLALGYTAEILWKHFGQQADAIGE